VNTIRNKLLVLFTTAALLIPAFQARAQVASDKPMLVVAISSVKELADDVAFLAKLAEIPGIDEQLPLMLELFGQGLDMTKPIGAVIKAKGLSIEAIAFIPVTNFQLALQLVEGTLGPAQDAGDGVFQLDTPLATVFMKSAGGYAYIAQAKEQLLSLPADPVKMLGGLEKKYDFAIQANLQAIPELYLTLVETQLQTGIELGLQPLPGESDEQYELRRQIAKQQMDQLIKAIHEIDTLTMGLSIDRPGKNVHLDFSVTAVEGTDLARQSALLQDMETAFSGFLPDNAAIRMNVVQHLAQEDIAPVELMLQTLVTNATAELDNDETLTTAQREALKGALTDTIAVLVDTLKGEKIDGAASVTFTGSQMVAIGGFKVVNGKKLDSALKTVLQLAMEEDELGGVVEIKFDAAQHKGTNFHTLSIPLPEYPEEPQKIFGPTVEVVIGISDTGAYVGVGQNSLAAVKAAIDASSEPKIVAPVEFTASVIKCIKFAAAVAPDDIPAEGKELIAKISSLTGEDNISLKAEPIPNGSRFRIQVDEMAIKAIGLAIQGAMRLVDAPPAPLGF